MISVELDSEIAGSKFHCYFSPHLNFHPLAQIIMTGTILADSLQILLPAVNNVVMMFTELLSCNICNKEFLGSYT